MALRQTDRVNGFIHSVETIEALSTYPCNIRFMSDVSLYILENLANEDVSFLTRYANSFEQGGLYEPVEPNTTQSALVETTRDIIRRDLTMDCSVDIVGAINDIALAIRSNSCGCDIGVGADTESGEEGGSVPPPVGPIEFMEPVVVTDRKCKAANSIHQTLTGTFSNLSGYPVEDFALYGLVFVVGVVTAIFGLLAAPMVALIAGVAGSLAVFAGKLIISGVSISDMATTMTDNGQELVCELYNAVTANDARDAYLAVLVSHGFTATEVELVELLMTNALLNLLFFDTEDSATYWDTYEAPFDCSACSPSDGLWRIAPSGAFGIFTVGDVPIGNGFVDNGGATFSISSVPRTLPNEHAVCLEVQGWDASGTDTIYQGGQATGYAWTPAGASILQARTLIANPTCGASYILTGSGAPIPKVMPEVVIFYYLADQPFSIDITIDSLPALC